VSGSSPYCLTNQWLTSWATMPAISSSAITLPPEVWPRRYIVVPVSVPAIGFWLNWELSIVVP
jgi:lambda repressor-like predicted transcriptional regulator